MELVVTLFVLGVLGTAALCFCFVALVAAIGRALRRAAGAAARTVRSRGRAHAHIDAGP